MKLLFIGGIIGLVLEWHSPFSISRWLHSPRSKQKRSRQLEKQSGIGKATIEKEKVWRPAKGWIGLRLVYSHRYIQEREQHSLNLRESGLLKLGPDGYVYVAEGGAGGTLSTIGLCGQAVGLPTGPGPYTGGFTARISKVARPKPSPNMIDACRVNEFDESWCPLWSSSDSHRVGVGTFGYTLIRTLWNFTASKGAQCREHSHHNAPVAAEHLSTERRVHSQAPVTTNPFVYLFDIV